MVTTCRNIWQNMMHIHAERAVLTENTAILFGNSLKAVETIMQLTSRRQTARKTIEIHQAAASKLWILTELNELVYQRDT